MRRYGFWIGAVVVTAIVAVGCCFFWNDLQEDAQFAGVSAVVRNVGLVWGGLIGLMLAAWRSQIAENQTEISQLSLLNERFKTGIELLGHRDMSVRLGGVYALNDIAKLEPQHYHVRVMEIFVAFLAYPPRYSGGDHDGQIDFTSAETVKIVEFINSRTKKMIEIEELNEFVLEEKLRKTHFPIENGRIKPVPELRPGGGYPTTLPGIVGPPRHPPSPPSPYPK